MYNDYIFFLCVSYLHWRTKVVFCEFFICIVWLLSILFLFRD